MLKLALLIAVILASLSTRTCGAPMLDSRSTHIPIPKHFSSYTAIGDSYAAGVGSYPPFDGNSDDKRTTVSYPARLNAKLNNITPTAFNFLAASGADTTDVLEQIKSPDFEDPELVSISIGGNDKAAFNIGGFKSVVALCIYHEFDSENLPLCDHAIKKARKAIHGIAGVLDAVIGNASTTNTAQSSHARTVAVMGYAQFYDLNTKRRACPADQEHFHQPDQTPGGHAEQINELITAVNQQLNASALRHGAHFVDVDAAFERHRICDAEPWFQVSGDVPGALIMHPTADGYGAMMQAMVNTLGV